ncbi:hypothetical protein LOAG_01640 [Loa loa]|uniref:Uncharacterized protein n=1 Tax=Loa loa TaxID=7209 RepID=A0A1I7VLU3_LOALO|nr:hypothetical protein LOAG_01640 [Loa loa]EFO26843.2 hypothetical protein LOAG_01640 [Loa loa]
MNTASTMPGINWLLSQGSVISPLTQQLSTTSNNYVLSSALGDGEHFRHRRPFRIRKLSPIRVPSQCNDQSLVLTNNIPQSAEKIVRFHMNQYEHKRQVSVLNADLTGGSKIVTRRREDGNLDVRIIYSREFIVAASASPYALLPPANFRQMVLEMMDIIAKFPKSYYNSIRTDIASESFQ